MVNDVVFSLIIVNVHFTITACEEGTTRLVGGREDTEGTVEICYFNLWGLVSVIGWNDTDASVVCYELGYSRMVNVNSGIMTLHLLFMLSHRCC